jgi:uncharacterized protein
VPQTSSRSSWLRSWFGQRQVPGPEVRMRVINLTRQAELASDIEVADTGPKRNKGLLGRKGLERGGGLWILPCEAVHTFWMQFPLDLIYLDRALRVKKVRSNVPPWRLSACLSAHSVLELASGTIRETRTEAGDMLKLEPVDPEQEKT